MMRGSLVIGSLWVLVGCDDGGLELVEVEGRDTVSLDQAEAWLDTEVQFVDARSQEDFEDGHLPGASSLPANLLRATVDGIDGQVASRVDAELAFADAGIDASRPVVVYGAENNTGTARTYWTLAYYGSAGGLRLLDGGVAAWEEAGLDLERGASTAGTVNWTGDATLDRLRVDKAWMLDHLDDATVAIFDVRSAEEYAAGHIPGAIHVEWTQNLDDDDFFLATSDVLASHGNPMEETVVVYCQSGSRAGVSWSLLDAAGLPDVRLYDGSWNEWGTDPDTPKVEGANPTR